MHVNSNNERGNLEENASLDAAYDSRGIAMASMDLDELKDKKNKKKK